MEDKNISPERKTQKISKRISLCLKRLLIVIFIAIVLGIVLMILNIFFGIKVSGVSYPALSKILSLVGVVIYTGGMGYFLKGSIREIKDKKLTLWQKIAKLSIIILVAGTIVMVITGMITKNAYILAILLSVIMLQFIVLIIICLLFSKEEILFK